MYRTVPGLGLPGTRRRYLPKWLWGGNNLLVDLEDSDT